MLINTDLKKLNAKNIFILANNRQIIAFKKTWKQQKAISMFPKVFTWNKYLHHIWLLTCPNSHLRYICTLESRHLINGVIATSKKNNSLINEVIKNYNYCKTHLINVNELTNSSKSFVTWIKAYQNKKLKLDLIDDYDLSNIIISLVADTVNKINKPYIYGFKTLTPEQKLLLKIIGYKELKTKKANTSSNNKTFETLNDEIFNAAVWAKDINDKKSIAQIAIVCPNLSELHYQFKATFDEVFTDTLVETKQKSYNISLGKTLLQYPLIQHILLILKLSSQIWKDDINTTDFNTLATSPYIKAANKEKYKRVFLINSILELSKAKFKLSLIKKQLSTCPALAEIIDSVSKHKNTCKQNLDKWLLDFNKLLQVWGFMSDRKLNSDEYQLINKYQQTSLCLNKIAKYNSNATIAIAIKILKDWLLQIIFQPHSSNSNIHILGNLEAEGMLFDYAWVVSLSSDFLPAKLNSLYFIPAYICTKHQIPNSNYTLVHEHAQKTLHNLYALANEVVFSYSKNNNQPSPLIKFNVDTIPINYKSQPLLSQSLDDTKAPIVSTKHIKNGANTLKNQMACAFKGFSQRLHIDEPKPVHIGFNRIEQGNTVHSILAGIFKQIRSQKELIKYTQEELTVIIKSHIDNSLGLYPKSGFKKIEHNRLSKLITEFIDAEKQRVNFEVIATEKTKKANIKGIAFNIRFDRMDKIDNNNIVIFDYKTGNKTSTTLWYGDTIKEPQLPIYATCNNTDGIAFIGLNQGKISYNGLTRNKNLLPQQKHLKNWDWDSQITEWSNKLNKSSTDFQQGRAEVMPTKDACIYCIYDSLCRVKK